ncbi:hypothetical protein CLV40_101259 [Actinokineospora auranticolor]|uniref:Uncharacterized protein n=1 Tax=Actinokineospora auranticolor TaxID=155976 RepID=A0A2S6H0S2_9PSEU|nr:hypothetical protein CLV40_101259 [Actinokineospora auranticolor]
MVNIGERPKEDEDRAVPDFREGDPILGSACKSQIPTLVERQTRFVMPPANKMTTTNFWSNTVSQ